MYGAWVVQELLGSNLGNCKTNLTNTEADLEVGRGGEHDTLRDKAVFLSAQLAMGL